MQILMCNSTCRGYLGGSSSHMIYYWQPHSSHATSFQMLAEDREQSIDSCEIHARLSFARESKMMAWPLWLQYLLTTYLCNVNSPIAHANMAEWQLSCLRAESQHVYPTMASCIGPHTHRYATCFYASSNASSTHLLPAVACGCW